MRQIDLFEKLFVLDSYTWNRVQIISIRLEYLKSYNCVSKFLLSFYSFENFLH